MCVLSCLTLFARAVAYVCVCMLTCFVCVCSVMSNSAPDLWRMDVCVFWCVCVCELSRVRLFVPEQWRMGGVCVSMCELSRI